MYLIHITQILQSRTDRLRREANLRRIDIAIEYYAARVVTLRRPTVDGIGKVCAIANRSVGLLTKEKCQPGNTSHPN